MELPLADGGRWREACELDYVDETPEEETEILPQSDGYNTMGFIYEDKGSPIHHLAQQMQPNLK